MLKKFMKKKNNKGFSLVELVIVVAILAILVGVLSPQYTKYVEKSRKAADVSNLENMVTAVKIAAADGSKDIAAGKYEIKINQKVNSATPAVGTEVSVVTTDGATADVNKADVETALSEFVGADWSSTILKSKKWTDEKENGDAQDYISAVIEIKTDGSMSVEYDPTWLKNMSDQDDATPVTNE